MSSSKFKLQNNKKLFKIEQKNLKTKVIIKFKILQAINKIKPNDKNKIKKYKFSKIV